MNILWNSPKLCFPSEHMHCQTHQPKECSRLCKLEKAAEGGFVRGRHAQAFPKDMVTRVHGMQLALSPKHTRCPIQQGLASSQIRGNYKAVRGINLLVH